MPPLAPTTSVAYWFCNSQHCAAGGCRASARVQRRSSFVVNSTIYGGSGGSVGTYSLAGGATEIAIHEMGHTAFGLADEYPYYAGATRRVMITIQWVSRQNPTLLLIPTATR